MKRALIGLIGLFLLLAQFALPAGALAAPAVTVSPGAGPRGTAVAVTAAGLRPDTTYLVQLVRGTGNVNTVRVFEDTAASDARGDLRYSLTVDQDPDGYTVRIVAVGGTVIATAPFSVTSEGLRYFPETEQMVRGRFLTYWAGHGLDLGDPGISERESLALFGYPLSAERRELLEDGREYTVQYFERARLEHHPENQPPYDVLLGQFGRRAVLDSWAVTARAEPLDGHACFPETGHNLGGRFREYWEANGGLAQFGYPISEPTSEPLLPGQPMIAVQYFERARLELHPDNQAPYDVLLGQFGRRALADADLLATAPTFARLYLADPRVPALVGRPVAPAVSAPGAYQGFERGLMLWRGDTREIYVLCGGDQRTGADVRGPLADTWAEGQPAGGGGGPRPGLYELGRGFGKLWRADQGIRDCLGYATSAGETGYPLVLQPFRRLSFDNLLITAATPEGRFVYAVYSDFIGSSSCISRPALCRPDYARFPDPLP